MFEQTHCILYLQGWVASHVTLFEVMMKCNHLVHPKLLIAQLPPPNLLLSHETLKVIYSKSVPSLIFSLTT